MIKNLFESDQNIKISRPKISNKHMDKIAILMIFFSVYFVLLDQKAQHKIGFQQPISLLKGKSKITKDPEEH